MTNYEKNADKLIPIILEPGNVAVDSRDGQLVRCDEILCTTCKFFGSIISCRDALEEWLRSECKE
jgi:hypothetical protein